MWKILSLVVLNVLVWTPSFIYLASGAPVGLPYFSFSIEDHPQLPEVMKDSCEGKQRLLYQDYYIVHGNDYETRNQLGPTCVGHSAAAAIDFLAALEVRLGHRNLPPPSQASASWIYAASREFGGMPDFIDGSHCRLAVKSMQEVGFVFNQSFIFEGIDLTYDDKVWKRTPPELDRYASNYISGYYQLNSYEDVRDAICNDMPVLIGSNVGFGDPRELIVRDRDGFLRQPIFFGSIWNHAMLFIGVDDSGRRGVLCLNSWGKTWVTGPKRFGDEPDGSFWIDARTVDKMARQGDCFAIYGLRRL